MMFSIVMAYNDRLPQLKNTLDSFKHFYKDIGNKIQIVIIDDSSEDENELKNFIDENAVLSDKYPFHFTYEYINRKDTKFRNPAILYNKAVELAKYENIMITNPENLHTTNVIEHVAANLEAGMYIVYGCKTVNQPPSFEAIYNSESQFVIENDPNSRRGWYQHSVFNNRLFHFLAAIKKSDYQSFGGFDPEYDKGVAVDDNDFICEVDKAGLRIVSVDDVYACHQSHRRPANQDVEAEYKINLMRFIAKWGASPYDIMPILSNQVREENEARKLESLLKNME